MKNFLFMVIFFTIGYISGSSSCYAQNNVQGALQYLNQFGQSVGSVMPIGSSQVVLNQYGQPVGFIIPSAPAPASLPLPSVLPTLPMMPVLGAIK
jgi:hypothetical protein